MPRKTKEVEEKKPNKSVSSKSSKVATTSKEKSATSKKSTVKSDSTTSKKAKTSKTEKTEKTEKVEPLKSATSKSKSTKSRNIKASNTKSTKTRNAKTSNTKSTRSSKTTKSKKSNVVSVMEYYDLPYRYNQTVVKILAQTPNMLFVYWDIADEDRKAFENHYGNDFFSKTKPVLIIHNETMNYSFEIEINDFANSWYLHVNDANCKYVIELGRRPYSHISTINEDYIYVSSSNEMEAPNNHILFEKFNPNVTYKNTKTGGTSKKDFSTIANYKNMQEIYNIYDLYKTIFKDELFGEITSNDLTNPSSMSSSSFK